MLIAVLACTSRAPVPSPEPGVEELDRAVLVATGDVMMHGSVKAAAADADVRVGGVSTNHDGFDDVWADLVPDIRPADLAFANLEFPVAPERGARTREMVFAAPPVVLDSLATLGLDVVSFANNHVYDQGRDGFVATLDALDRAGIAGAGAGRSCDQAEGPQVFVLGGLEGRDATIDGIRVAVLAYTVQFNDYLNGPDRSKPCAAFFDEAAATAAVAQAREDGAEIVVLSMHWGTEYAPTPSPRQVALAYRLVDAGVDVLLGSHPHVLQPIEVVRASDGRLAVVAYSLGNFVSNQAADYRPGRDVDADGSPRDGVLLQVALARRRYASDDGPIERVEVADVDPVLLWTENDPRGVPAIDVARAEDQIARLARVGRGDEADALSQRIVGVRAALGP